MNKPYQLIASVLLGALSSIIWCESAFAGRRVALVVGNATYENVAPLPNPANETPPISGRNDQAEARSYYRIVENVGQVPAAIPPEVRTSPRNAETDDQAAWDWLKDSDSVAVLTDFIARYPSSAMVDSARLRRAALERAEKELEVQRAHRDEAMVRLTQKELLRIGCFSGPVDGNFNDATQAAISRYQLQFGEANAATEITEQLISDLRARTGRACPLVCAAGQVAQGNQCVAARKPVPAARQASEESRRSKAKSEEARTRPAVRAQPSGRTEAGSSRSRPSGGLFIGIGGSGFGIGAGF